MEEACGSRSLLINDVKENSGSMVPARLSKATTVMTMIVKPNSTEGFLRSAENDPENRSVRVSGRSGMMPGLGAQLHVLAWL